MPMVNGKKYPYTKAGKAAAEKARKKKLSPSSRPAVMTSTGSKMKPASNSKLAAVRGVINTQRTPSSGKPSRTRGRSRGM